MTKDDIKALGLLARSFKASKVGRAKPSNDLLYLWFVSKAQAVRKCDVQVFDVWLRSPDGVEPYPSPNGLQQSIFPSGGVGRVTDDAWTALHLVYLADTERKLWAVSSNGIMHLATEAVRLP